jgi:isopentenyldiphosphate isomerase
MDEIVDIVDENDNLVGQELKSKCHANKILHRGAAILIFKDESFKEILIQKRSLKKTVKPGKLSIPAGHLSLGENYFTGAKRELQEELFHKQKLPSRLKFEKLFKIKKFADNDYEFNVVYRIIYPGPFFNDPEEVEDSYFEDINETLSKVKKESREYTETTILLLEEYKQRFIKK